MADQPTWRCRLWGHTPDGSSDGWHCRRCGLSPEVWAPGVTSRLSDWCGRPRRTGERWPYVRQCSDCARVCEVLGYEVGDHRSCIEVPF